LFVLSEPRVEIDGSAEHIAVEAEQHRQRLAELHHRVASATGRSADDVAADLRTGRVLGAAEAEAYGLVHEVTQSHRT
jgi:ATP-dependent Clp protease protease subunit